MHSPPPHSAPCVAPFTGRASPFISSLVRSLLCLQDREPPVGLAGRVHLTHDGMGLTKSSDLPQIPVSDVGLPGRVTGVSQSTRGN